MSVISLGVCMFKFIVTTNAGLIVASNQGVTLEAEALFDSATVHWKAKSPHAANIA